MGFFSESDELGNGDDYLQQAVESTANTRPVEDPIAAYFSTFQIHTLSSETSPSDSDFP